MGIFLIESACPSARTARHPPPPPTPFAGPFNSLHARVYPVSIGPLVAEISTRDCAQSLLTQYMPFWGRYHLLALARTWGGGGCHPSRQFFWAARYDFKDIALIFGIADFPSFLEILWKFQVSVTFGSWDMTSFSRSCHGPITTNASYPEFSNRNNLLLW